MIRKLGPQDSEQMYLVQESSADYYLLESGFPQPENKLLPFENDSIQFFGYFDPEQRLLGFVDVLSHYPQLNDWHIGLMVFLPESRGKGYGTRLLNKITQEAYEAGVERLFVAPLEANKPALKFWKKHGFSSYELLVERSYGSKIHNVYHLCKVL